MLQYALLVQAIVAVKTEAALLEQPQIAGVNALIMAWVHIAKTRATIVSKQASQVMTLVNGMG